MNAVKAIKDYVTKMIQEMPGMKVLLLDEDTVRPTTLPVRCVS